MHQYSCRALSPVSVAARAPGLFGRRLPWLLVIAIDVFATSMLGIPAAGAAQPGESFTTISSGGWCWFSDPRAIWVGDSIWAASVSSNGHIRVDEMSWHRRDRHMVLHVAFERDDHDVPALLMLPDGRVAAFYSMHARGDMRMRVTPKAGEVKMWDSERELGFVAPGKGSHGTTYANPVLLSREKDAIYLFWRGDDFKPTFSVSHDLGATWSRPRTLIARPGADETNRPYMKVYSNGLNRIDFAFTDGHPRDEPTNSLYYMRYERGAFWRADGTKIGTMDELPLDPARCDRVYDGRTSGRAWVWDVAAAEGRPMIAFTQLPKETDHRYAIASWSGTRWQITELCAAGGWFPHTPAGQTEREPHYSGGIALNPSDPETVYISRPIDGVFEIERWHWEAGREAWRRTLITAGSRQDNVRPFVVRGDRHHPAQLMWMSSRRYVHYTDYEAELKLSGL